MKKLHKSAMFTDIHFGRKANSEQHNQDCLDFITWFTSQIKKDKTIDHIIFLGDWFEIRSSIDQLTIKYSQQACDLLNDLEMPIYMLVGNHDMYTKHTRDIYSTSIFKEYDNISLISTPTVIKEIGDGSVLLPYLFKHEYADLAEFKKHDVWFGHLELNNFYITGYHKVIMEHAIDPKLLEGPSFIFTGHFHKRQSYANITYIGSPFGYDFSDMDDFSKGMAIFDHVNKKCEFLDYDGPKFIQIKLSKLLKQISGQKFNPSDNTSIKCIMDTDISYENHIKLNQLLKDKFKLRGIVFEETEDLKEVLEETDEIDIDAEELQKLSLNEMVLKMLESIESDKIDNEKLIKIYKDIRHA